MGGTTNVEVTKPAAEIDLNKEVPISVLKLPPEQLTPEAKAAREKFFTEQMGTADTHVPNPTAPTPLQPRSGTPVSDAYRRREATATLEQKQAAADAGNVLAGGLRAASEVTEKNKYQGVGGVDEPTPKLPEISFSDFQKIEIRVGEIKAVDGIPGADKLLKLTVNFGELGTRIIAAGIRSGYDSLEHAQKSLVEGRYAFVTNLGSRKLKGVESQGMLLATHTETNQALLIDCKDHVIGARLG